MINFRSFAQKFSWDLFSKLIGQFFGLFIAIILARLLSPEEFGVIAISMVFVSILEYVVNSGLGSAIIQRKEINEKHLSTAFYTNLILSIFVAFIFLLFSKNISVFFSKPILYHIINYVSFVLLLSGLTIVQQSLLQRKLEIKKLSLINLFSSLMGGVTGVIFAVLGYGIYSLVAQIIIDKILRTFLLWFSSSWRPKILFHLDSLKELWTFGFNMFLSGLINTSFSQISNVVIAKLFSVAELGLFSKAKRFNYFVIKYSSESINSVGFPALSKLQDEKDRLVSYSDQLMSFISFMCFGLLALFYLIGESMVLLLLGDKWVEVVWMFKLLCLSGFVFPLSSGILSLLKASGDSKTFFELEIRKKIVDFIGLVFGFYFGLKGYLISLIFTSFINVFLNIYYTCKSLNISIYHQIKNIVFYPIISILLVFIIDSLVPVFSTYILNILFLSIIFCVLYLLLNFFFKTQVYLFVKQKFFT